MRFNKKIFVVLCASLTMSGCSLSNTESEAFYFGRHYVLDGVSRIVSEDEEKQYKTWNAYREANDLKEYELGRILKYESGFYENPIIGEKSFNANEESEIFKNFPFDVDDNFIKVSFSSSEERATFSNIEIISSNGIYNPSSTPIYLMNKEEPLDPETKLKGSYTIDLVKSGIKSDDEKTRISMLYHGETDFAGTCTLTNVVRCTLKRHFKTFNYIDFTYDGLANLTFQYQGDEKTTVLIGSYYQDALENNIYLEYKKNDKNIHGDFYNQESLLKKTTIKNNLILYNPTTVGSVDEKGNVEKENPNPCYIRLTFTFIEYNIETGEWESLGDYYLWLYDGILHHSLYTNKRDISLKVGEEARVSVTLVLTQNIRRITKKDISWKCSDSLVASITVDDNGDYITIKGTGSGECIVSAKTIDSSSYLQLCYISVTEE